MDILFTIELRVACVDDNKYVLAKHMVQQAAIHTAARIALSDDGEGPQVTVYSHDYEHGYRDILRGDDYSQIGGTTEAALSLATGCFTAGRPILRVIEGGRTDRVMRAPCK